LSWIKQRQSSTQTVSNFIPCLLRILSNISGAQAYMSLEEFGKAIEDCDTALKIDPTHTKVKHFLEEFNFTSF
jgi:hypothetical protein